ncbi:hypothetical protein HBI49_055760 [Parastagonospora nodorum]|nr:hypothetical protein HBH43_048940 [Parastagonospora nodorum]KAH4186815.1 hypothetical protein HBI95_237110 [Parastagonospora nodorum]KAH4819467.1 hypothetical protein HBH61_027790 [Parastagonospora nodorum]KAH5374388.1 hypothetical protein HBI49_055760 [Parastagonospora nodorum]KAH5616138.1 hypothetical protein HBI45_020570 [Parastagonospora nodorum]
MPIPKSPLNLIPPSIKLSTFSSNLRAAQNIVRPSPTTIRLGKIYGPPVPDLDTDGQAKCDWCFQTIDQAIVKEGQWTPRGIAHYQKDLEPFPCLSELCLEKAPSFRSRKDWDAHMFKHHLHWPQYIHRGKMWICRIGLLGSAAHREGESDAFQSKYTHESAAYFSSANHFMSHVKTMHYEEGRAPWNDADLLALSDECVVELSLDAAVCPICHMAQEGPQNKSSKSMHDHIAAHLQGIMLLSVSLIQALPRGSEDAEIPGHPTITVAHAGISDIEAAEADRDDRMADLSSLSSTFTECRPVSPDLDAIPADQEPLDTLWTNVRVKIQEDRPLESNETDQYLSQLENDFVHIPEDEFDEGPVEPLQTGIRTRTMLAAGSTRSLFLPLSELENLVNDRNVRQELKRSGLTEGLDKILLDVLRPQKPQTDTDITTTRRKIFAILCLMNRSKDIRAFIEEEIFDADLPFEFISGRRVLRSPKKGKPGVPIRLFMHSNVWDYLSLDLFEDYQNRFMAPYFKLMTQKIRPYIFHRCVVLPFLGIEAKNGAYSVEIETLFSAVSRVEIHPAHHDYQSPHGSSDKMYFAVKQLQKTEILESAQANREIRAYKRVNSIHHAHIVRLLAIYAHLDRLHMIFPWADGNLYQFWEKHFPDACSLPRSHSLAKWMANQFYGLADGLRRIHKLEVDPSLDELQPEDHRRTHGRYGHIKPENILWFKSPGKESAMDQIGKLMISDLGSRDFHGTFSKDVEVHAAGGYTSTYTSPESDFDKQITPESDIWSFGCVLLEFVVWYILGWHGVRDFAEQRNVDSNTKIPSDQFFNFFEYKHDLNEAKLKSSVYRTLAILRESDASSDLMIDLLDLIESRLLRSRTYERASCDELVAQLDTIKNSCAGSEKYCVQVTRGKLARIPSDLSEKLVTPVFSAERKNS